MLRRALAAAAVTIASLVIVVAAAPNASADCTANPQTGQVECEDSNSGGAGGGGGSSGSSSTCTHQGEEIPCQLEGVGSWNGECYVTPTPVEVQPPPPEGQTKDDGAWYYCIYPSGGGGTFAGTTWVANGTTLIDPAVLAQRAVASMDLDPIRIGIVPESGPGRVGLVGMPVWMWVDSPTDDTFGPITASASEGTVSVSATANVTSIVWNMGDGTEVACGGTGTPYADRYGRQDSPTCGHRYEAMSDDQPGDAYQVTATSHWVVEWMGGGQSGTIEFDLTTDPLPVRIGEAQTLTS